MLGAQKAFRIIEFRATVRMEEKKNIIGERGRADTQRWKGIEFQTSEAAIRSSSRQTPNSADML
jgi:hypothetical protein